MWWHFCISSLGKCQQFCCKTVENGGVAARWHHLVSLSYKASPVPSPIRSSFDTQLSNQDLGFLPLTNDWSGRLQTFSSINSGCSFWEDWWAEFERAATFTPGGRLLLSKEANKQTNKVHRRKQTNIIVAEYTHLDSGRDLANGADTGAQGEWEWKRAQKKVWASDKFKQILRCKSPANDGVRSWC